MQALSVHLGISPFRRWERVESEKALFAEAASLSSTARSRARLNPFSSRHKRALDICSNQIVEAALAKANLLIHSGGQEQAIDAHATQLEKTTPGSGLENLAAGRPERQGGRPASHL
jgi:hypothetical protein